ncbi:MAG: glycosyltransferase family 4 protein [bacterium]
MRILIIAPSAYILGGVQNCLDYLLPGLQSLGSEVILGLPDGDIHRGAEYLSAHPWSCVELITNPTGSAQGRVNAIVEKILKVKPDVVVSVNMGDCLEAVATLRVSGQLDTRLVHTIHAIEADYMSDLEHYQNVVDGVIYTNRLVKPLIETRVDIETSRLFYAPYGVEVLDNIERPKANMQSILWMGRLEQSQKRCLELPLIAMALDSMMPSWELALAGDGPEADQLRGEFAKTAQDRVRWLGCIPHKQLLEEVLPKTDVLLVNSTWETGPITIWEAMAAGVPVVTSRYTGSGVEQSLVNEHNVLMFDIGDVHAAAKCISLLFSDAGLRNRLVSHGHELVKQKYSIPHSVESWHRALLAVMDLPPRESIEHSFIEHSANGRLDRWLGLNLGEKVRGVLRKSWKHHTAGSEWPHARYGASVAERENFMELARAFDRQGRQKNYLDPSSL